MNIFHYLTKRPYNILFIVWVGISRLDHLDILSQKFAWEATLVHKKENDSRRVQPPSTYGGDWHAREQRDTAPGIHWLGRTTIAVLLQHGSVMWLTKWSMVKRIPGDQHRGQFGPSPIVQDLYHWWLIPFIDIDCCRVMVYLTTFSLIWCVLALHNTGKIRNPIVVMYIY